MPAVGKYDGVLVCV